LVGDKSRKTPAAEESGADGKRYYRIGEVSKITGVEAYVLRYWESQFRWMTPAKSRAQQRLYRKRDIDIILLIKRLLYQERFTIAGAKKKLQELGMSRALDTPQLDLALDADPRQQLRRIREALQEVRAALV